MEFGHGEVRLAARSMAGEGGLSGATTYIGRGHAGVSLMQCRRRLAEGGDCEKWWIATAWMY